MASKFDKSLEEIIREKGIQNPTIKKKKNQTQTPKFLKTISKKSYWQKIANEDGKTFEAPAKCSVNITGMVYLFHFVLLLICICGSHKFSILPKWKLNQDCWGSNQAFCPNS